MPHPTALPPPNSTVLAWWSHREGWNSTGTVAIQSVLLQGTSANSSFCSAYPKGKRRKKEKTAKVQYVFLLLSSLMNSSHLSLPQFMRLCSCTGPFLVCPDLPGTNLPDSLVDHISRAIPDPQQPRTRGDCQSPKDGSSYFASTLAGFVSVGMCTLPFAFAMAPACWWTAVLLFIP